MSSRPLHLLAFAAFAALAPIVLLVYVGGEKVYLGGWVHFAGVGIGAGIATAAAVALTVAGARERDGRAVLVGCAFSVMASLLLLHGLTSPGVFFELNGVVSLTGGLTLPVGGLILALSALPAVGRPGAVRPLLWLLGTSVAVVFVLGVLALVEPSFVPSVPEARSPEALLLLAGGLLLFGVLFLRALRTFRLTQRFGDLLVAVGIVWLAVALVPALTQDYWNLGWWLGHAFEIVGIALVGGAVAVDLYRGSARASRPLVGDLRAVELVTQEEAFLGSHVRALLVSLAEKDASTEEHTRRVALRAVEVGEELGLPPARLRGLALGGLLHDMGKLAVPGEVLRKPGALTDAEFELVKRHPEAGVRLLRDLGFPGGALSLVGGHHERLDGSGYPGGIAEDGIDLDTRVLAVCDVYDALVSPRVYREAWGHERALALLRDGSQYDQRCVAALERVVSRERSSGLAVAV